VSIKNKILAATKFLDDLGYSPVPMKVRIAHILNGITEPPKCCICGSNASLKAMRKGVPTEIYSKVCSEECGRRVSNARKFDDDIYDKITSSRDWLYEKHVVRRESIQFIAKTYGPSEPFVKRWLTKWGIPHCDYRLAQPESGAKMKDRDWLFNAYVTQHRSIYDIGAELNVHGSTVARYIKEHGLPINATNSYDRKFARVTKPELEIVAFIESLGLGVDVQSSNRRVLNGRELDVYVAAKKFAIEYDGFPHHTEVFGGKDRHYHVAKTKDCAAQGIKLLHITSSEWDNDVKQEVWKSMIASMLGANATIYARNCTIDFEVASNEAREFLSQNHLQGARKGDSYKIGLRHNGELVSLMCFAKSRISAYDWELTRFCSKRYLNVTGAASKLVKAFTRTVGGDIISYADLRYSDGGLYKAIGFTEVSRGAPRYHYVKDGKMYNKQNFRRNKLKTAIKVYDEAKSERENMLANGYDLYWDCGTVGFALLHPTKKAP